MNFYVKTDELDRFAKKFFEYAELQKKDSHDLFEEQCRGITKNFFAVTPPMGGKSASVKLPKPGTKSRGIQVDWKQGLDAGKTAIDIDLNRAFDPASNDIFKMMVKWGKAQQTQEQFDWVKSWYNSNLTSRKRAKKSKLPVPERIVREMRKYLRAKQGWTASGWMAAASKLGVKGIPGWITRHNAPGEIDFQNLKKEMYFEATNYTNHVNSKKIEARMRVAVNMQANVIGRWLKDRAEKLAKGRIS
mgnify:CR=1 FL=1